MSEAIELMRELQGDMSDREFAKRLGMSRSAVRMVKSGQRNAGARMIRSLVKAFPERSQQITSLFLSSNGHNCIR